MVFWVFLLKKLNGIIRVISLVCVSLFVCQAANTTFWELREKEKVVDAKLVVLVGASIGRAWNIPGLSERVNSTDYVFEYQHGGSQFDKSRCVDNLLSSKENIPDAIFLKVCAAYFPDDLNKYKSLMESWIRKCLNAKIIPIPTTVVPVTRLHPFKKFFIDILKLRNPFKFGNPFQSKRIRTILEYNDWIRKYCLKKGLTFLDLEAAVRYSGTNRYLREDFSKLDGLHLNRKAYIILDEIVAPTLERVSWEKIKTDE